MDPLDPTCTKQRPLAEYSERLPSSRPGKRLNRATLWRWSLKGTSDRVLLRTARLGGCRYTCDAWVAEFMAALSSSPASEASPPTMREEDRLRIAERFGLKKASRP
jgi:hypothetical protein